jgi:hypothetical protein
MMKKRLRDLCGFKIEKDQFPARLKTRSRMRRVMKLILIGQQDTKKSRKVERTNYGDKNPF